MLPILVKVINVKSLIAISVTWTTSWKTPSLGGGGKGWGVGGNFLEIFYPKVKYFCQQKF